MDDVLLTTTRRLTQRRADRIRALAAQRRWLWLRLRYGVKTRIICPPEEA